MFSIAAAVATLSWGASPPSEAVRRDWYFRESLAAIRDWEAVLAEWEKTTPEAERTPVLPVPANGDAVEWPNPIPLMLLPDDDAKARVRVRFAGGKMEVEHIAPDGKSERKAIAPGDIMVGCRHPGGGAKDQWYHGYVRKFDCLTTFRPTPAPFALRIEARLDLRRGPSEIAIAARNVGDKALGLTLSLKQFSPSGEAKALGSRDVDIPPTKSETVRFPVELPAEGGGLLILTVAAAGESFWLPLLTHIEVASSILHGIDGILADAPDAVAEARLAALKRKAATWVAPSNLFEGGPAGKPPKTPSSKLEGATPGVAGPTWRALFEEGSALRDGLLLRRIGFDSLLFVKRKPFFSEQPYMDAHHCWNRPGGGIYRLSPVRPDGTVTPVVDSLGEGICRDLCLHWDGKRLLFAFGNGNDRGKPAGKPPISYHIYEANTDGTGLRQLTFGPKNDCEPLYLPDGRIAFTSDRSEFYVMCGSNIHVASLFVMNADGSSLRQLSYNCFNDFNPSLLPDGRIIYNRWEYNERSVTSLHDLFTMHPDGSMVAPYYGNATIRPNVIMFPRAVPGSPKVTALFTGHHGQTHGPIGLIDVRHGADGDAPIRVLTPGVPVIGERIEDSRFGWFSDPQPLSEDTYLCSYTPTVQPWLERSWALYVGDRHGNLALVYRDPAISCAEPVPLVHRPSPSVMPPVATEAESAEAALVVIDVYEGLSGVPRGDAKFLRLIEDVPRHRVPEGGVITTSGTPIYTVKRIFGTVPIEPDGSAHFAVPADRNVYFEVLDGRHREIQRMRSVVCLKPGERRTCIGCHEPRTMAPPNRLATAASRESSRPTPLPWGDKVLSFLRDVQPVLNAKCVRCHTHDRAANRVVLTDDLTDQFCIAYEELLPYLSVANAMRWDHPDDVYPRPPYTYGSKVSRLTQLLEAGHHDVQLTDEEWQRLFAWTDANGVYYDTYETFWPNRHIFAGDARKALDEVYGRRCARCHGKSDGRRDTWWLSLNWRDVKLSRALAAPLARAAGGWGRCGGTVFATAEDPDWKALELGLRELRDQLTGRPRADLRSLRGTAAEQQKVELPEAPPPRPAPKDELPKGDAIYLSDLKWEKGTAGWTCNKDGLPRLDKDVEDHPLSLGGRRYPRGIGTHAPSEIVYRLDGKFARFVATIGGAEDRGTVVFQVYGDGKRLFDGGVMHGLREVKDIDLPVAGVRVLRLVVTDAGDGITCDMANWAAARLVRPSAAGR